MEDARGTRATKSKGMAAMSDFPATRLVFSAQTGFVWRCPCGKRSSAQWAEEAAAVAAALQHIEAHAVRWGLSDEECRVLAEEWASEEQDRRLQAAATQALQRFNAGEFDSMGDAAIAVADEEGLDGDQEDGETGDLFALLEEQCPADTLWDWTLSARERKARLDAERRRTQEKRAQERERVLQTVRLTPEREAYVRRVALRIYHRFEGGLYPSMKVALGEAPTAFGLDAKTGEPVLLRDVLEGWCPDENLEDWLPVEAPRFQSRYVLALGFTPIPRLARSKWSCDACGIRLDHWEGPFGFSRQKRSPDSVERDGKHVHLDFECIARCFGQDSDIVLQLEAKLHVPRYLDPETELRKLQEAKPDAHAESTWRYQGFRPRHKPEDAPSPP